MKLLITGAEGQLGHDVVAYCAAMGDEVVGADRSTIDVTDQRAVDASIAMLQPDAVINCAAWTAVDACEAEPERAQLVNATAVAFLREACDAANAHLVQISTDYVFDGTKFGPYLEGDAPNPQSVYGTTKLGGEVAAGSASAIVRTSFVCGEHGHNMVKTVLRLIETHPTLSFVNDQIGNPSFTADLAPALRDIALRRATGVFHLTNSTDGGAGVSWFEFVRAVVDAAGGDPSIVHPITTAELDPPRPAPRPANSVLGDTRLASVGVASLRDYREPLRELIAALTA